LRSRRETPREARPFLLTSKLEAVVRACGATAVLFVWHEHDPERPWASGARGAHSGAQPLRLGAEGARRANGFVAPGRLDGLERQWQETPSMKHYESASTGPPTERSRHQLTSPRTPVRQAAAERGTVVWVTGLPASGKSTFGRALVEALKGAGRTACLLDGGDVRAALEPKPVYDRAGRDSFYLALAALASLLAGQGLVVVVAATAHLRAYRDRARSLAPAFVEIFVDVPLSECRKRDTTGLYECVLAGTSHALPGPQFEYEAPKRPDVVAFGGDDPVAIAGTVEIIRRGPPGGRAIDIRP
jgi:adenylylsulfate kinase